MSRTIGRRTISRAIIITILLAVVPGTWAQNKYKVLYKFTGGVDGSNPWGLVFDQAGNLYGTTSAGGTGSGCAFNPHCGTVFKLAHNPHGRWSEKVLYNFCSLPNCADGAEPAGNLIFDKAGNLYGTTSLGGSGSFGFGTVFELMPNPDGSWKEKILHQFTGGADGGAPESSMIFDSAGNLYGTAFQAGNVSQCHGIGCGVVFQLTPSADGSWTDTVLYSFTGSPDGSNPDSSLIFDLAGNLYGTTYYGGASSSSCVLGVGGCGTVFRLTHNADGTWAETVLHSFLEPRGAYLTSGLVFDQPGNLYGATSQGGNLGQCGSSSGCGLVFELSPELDGRWSEKVLHHFTGGADGGLPIGGVTFDPSGNLYGTTGYGGALDKCFAGRHPSGCGLVFRLAPNTKGAWTENVLHSFVNLPGSGPNAGVVFDAAGNLYGTTIGDRSTTFGSVFEITP